MLSTVAVDLFTVQKPETYKNKPEANFYRPRFFTAEPVVIWTILVLMMLQSKNILTNQVPQLFCSQILE